MVAVKINFTSKVTTKRTDLPNFAAGDTVKVHCKIIEGTKERIQIFQGLVIRRTRGNSANATFSVRKVSFNIGVERTFMLHSPRVAKIEVVSIGKVRRSKLFYLRELKGKAARIESSLNTGTANDGNKTEEENSNSVEAQALA